jgi:putative phosphoesterase
MHRIAVVADIHGNRFALDAVIDDLETHQVDEVIVAGDLVGRGPQGNDVVHRVANLGWRCVRGNHEDYLLNFCRDDVPESWWKDDEWAASRWMARELDADAVDFIESLPFSIHSRLAPSIQIFHGSPNSHSEGIGAWTPEGRLQEFLQAIDGSVLVCAHTHRPLEYESPQGLIVNVGSVGLPFNGDWHAQYAILEGEDDQWEVSFQRIPYDRQKFLELYETSGFLNEGGITATLLYEEVKFARPFLVPFLKWADATERPPRDAHLEEFLDLYDPDQSLAEFFESLNDGTHRPTMP